MGHLLGTQVPLPTNYCNYQMFFRVENDSHDPLLTKWNDLALRLKSLVFPPGSKANFPMQINSTFNRDGLMVLYSGLFRQNMTREVDSCLLRQKKQRARVP